MVLLSRSYSLICCDRVWCNQKSREDAERLVNSAFSYRSCQGKTCDRYVSLLRHRDGNRMTTAQQCCGDVKRCDCGLTVYTSTGLKRRDESSSDCCQTVSGKQRWKAKRTASNVKTRRQSATATSQSSALPAASWADVASGCQVSCS